MPRLTKPHELTERENAIWADGYLTGVEEAQEKEELRRILEQPPSSVPHSAATANSPRPTENGVEDTAEPGIRPAVPIPEADSFAGWECPYCLTMNLEDESECGGCHRKCKD